jgi:hypothetical protein
MNFIDVLLGTACRYVLERAGLFGSIGTTVSVTAPRIAASLAQ